jgi:hypothetical protein
MHVAEDRKALQAELELTATTDVDAPNTGICCMMVGVVKMVVTAATSAVEDTETEVSITTEPSRTFTTRTVPLFRRF